MTGVVSPGVASAAARATANQLLSLALACDEAGLVALAEQHGTRIGDGNGTTPQDAFELPEVGAGYSYYSLLVSSLTYGEPATVGGGDARFWTWYASEATTDWHVTIADDGTWVEFLPGNAPPKDG